MVDLILLVGGIVLLAVALRLDARRREEELLRRIDSLCDSPGAVAATVDQATEDERKREEEWRRQNPRGNF